MSNGALYGGREFIDASYEGDLMAPMDPYIVPGDPSSGLIQHVAPDTLGAPGTADKSIMAYNYRLCMSADPANQIRFSAPTDYDPAEFEVMRRLLTAYQKKGIALSFTSIFVSTPLAENKRDINSGFFVSTDDVGESAAYPEASLSDRQTIAAAHKEYLQGLLYFLATDSRVPTAIQTKLLSFGLCKDEFTDNGGWRHQLYVREARRMIGEYVMTENDAELKTTIPDSIGLGGYNFDTHYVNRIARNGMVYTDGRGVILTTHPYPISYRSLTPKAPEATNLLVPVDVSASHVAYESLRVEVTYMIMGQAAGAAVSLAIDGDVPVQSVNYSQLRTQLVNDGQVVAWP
jgi:FAD dependent oxidoreductase